MQGVWLTRSKEIKTLFSADDRVIIAKSKILLQKLHRLESVISKYVLTIPTSKTKTVAFRGRDHIRSNLVINNKVIEQINTHNYLGCLLSYEKKMFQTNYKNSYRSQESSVSF
jgi:hypothetical protein